jgi:hypothetical protein
MRSKASLTSINGKLSAGLEEYYNKKSLVLAGTTWTATSILATLAKEDALIASSDAARAAWNAQLKAQREQTAANNQLRKALHAAVLVNFGTNPSVLNAFGYVAQAPKRTVQAKATAVQKVQATRVARHTMGPKQRASIHGVIATPVPAPTATDTATTASSSAAIAAIAPTGTAK